MEATMKLFASILLTFALVSLATAAPITAFSVSNIVRTGDNTYTADKNTVDTHGEKTPGDGIASHITIKTTDCTHVPGSGATAIYLTTPNGTEVLFSDGGTCKVKALANAFQYDIR
jgi:hypothetical protein